MPFKSRKQQAKFAELVKKGLMPKSTFDEWNRDTPHDIPERVKPKARPARAPSIPKGYIKPIKAK